MKKRDFILIAIVVALACVYVVYFTDWFKPEVIHISSTSRDTGQARRFGLKNNSTTIPVIFGLDRAYALSEIKVVPLAAFQTNEFAPPVWHLVSESGSDDINHFFYGERIDGMDPVVEGARAEPLQPGVTYRLFVTAGKIKGWHDFQAKPAN